MKKKLIIAVPVLLLAVVGAVYKLVLAPKPKPAPPAKVQGVLVPLANEFVVNLAGGHYGKVSVALLMTKAPPAPAEGTPPTLPQNAVIRATIALGADTATTGNSTRGNGRRASARRVRSKSAAR